MALFTQMFVARPTLLVLLCHPPLQAIYNEQHKAAVEGIDPDWHLVCTPQQQQPWLQTPPAWLQPTPPQREPQHEQQERQQEQEEAW